MRFLLIRVLTVAVIVGLGWFGRAQDTPAEKGTGFEGLLTAYLQNRIEGARLALRQLQESETATLPDLMAAEDEIDRWRLHLRLATEAKLIADHPVFSELRREFAVPEVLKITYVPKREVVSAAIQEYLEKKLQRAERASERAQALVRLGRGTESDVLAARSTVQGLKLLLEAERLNSRKGRR